MQTALALLAAKGKVVSKVTAECGESLQQMTARSVTTRKGKCLCLYSHCHAVHCVLQEAESWSAWLASAAQN